ncbi:P-loop containing nucleoside triphosphate hydrolase protein, partial [Schizophyllum amplum]
RFLPMLAAEQEEEQKLVRERLATWPLAKLTGEGYCLQGMSAYWLEADLFGRPVASFTMGPGMTLPEHKFESGVQVLISRVDPLKETPHTGSVVSYTKSQLKLSFLQRFELEDGQWRLDLGRSNIVYERTKTAISQLRQDPLQIQNMDAGRKKEYITQGTYLRDVLLQSFKPVQSGDESAEIDPATVSANSRELHAPDSHYPVTVLDHESRTRHDNRGIFKDDMRIQSWADRYSRPNPIAAEGDPELEGLNATQLRAVATMIGQRISLVQGPPGTGKTRTIIETVKLLKAHFEVPQPLMICTYTNVAVDNLVEGLVKAGLKPLRIGFGGKVQPDLLEHALDHKLSTHPARPAIDAAQEERRKLNTELDELKFSLQEDKARLASGSSNLRVRVQRKQTAVFAKKRALQALTSKVYRMEQQVLREIVDAADVVCTTCISAASVVLNVADFPVVFIDEASMSTEPASLVPLMKGSQHVALIGDHKQLPPVITSSEAQALGLGYRMHPKIAMFPSSEFYAFGLRNGTVDSGGKIPSRLRPPRTSAHLRIRTGASAGSPDHDAPPVIFLNHTSYESTSSRSRVNHVEAQIVASVVEDLLLHNPGLQGTDIGVIAPYAAQISLLDRLLRKKPDWQQRFTAVLGSHRALQLANIEIKTVDGFEGREKDVIIFSTVRNNSSGYIGFLADERRLNVGLTRAKRGLFVVGGIDTLKAGKHQEEPEMQPTSPKLVAADQTLAATPVLSTEAAIDMTTADKSKRTRTKKTTRTNKGVEVWRRYAKWLTDEGLVITLSGSVLNQTLYGNVRRAKKALQAIAADAARQRID